MINSEKLASLFDHTNLRSYADTRDIDILCNEAISFKFASVCIYGYWVNYVAENYPGLKICQVLNFPTGLSNSHVETLSQINSNSQEYDIVLNISQLKEQRFEEIKEDLKAVRNFTQGKVLKVIIESGVLNNEELVEAVDLVAEVGADFVKTSTGFIAQPAEHLIQQVSIISHVIKLHNLPIEIKASGGINSLDQVKILIGLGVTRIGSSSSVKIIQELERSK